jgi:hypothetical protein
LGKADLSWQIEWPKKGAEPAFLDNPLGEFDEEVIDNAEIPPHLLREPMTIGQQALKIENLTTRNKDLATMVKQMKINLKKRQTAYFDCGRTAIQMSFTCGRGDVRSK